MSEASELITFTSVEINALLNSIGNIDLLSTSEKQNLVAAINELKGQIDNAAEQTDGIDQKTGDVSNLLTEAKSNLVAAVNEVFTFAGEGKAAIAAAITGAGVTANSNESWASLAAKIEQIRAEWIEPFIDNLPITPTGSYASSTYYDVEYGVRVGYCENGEVMISMKGGTSTAYENINFELGTAPEGVTILKNSTSYDTSDPAGNLFVCVLSGIIGHATIDIDMSALNSSYDYVTATVNITEATA